MVGGCVAGDERATCRNTENVGGKSRSKGSKSKSRQQPLREKWRRKVVKKASLISRE